MQLPHFSLLEYPHFVKRMRRDERRLYQQAKKSCFTFYNNYKKNLGNSVMATALLYIYLFI